MQMLSTAFARGLLLEPRLPGARAKLGFDLIKADAARVQHDHQVVQQVGRFRDHALVVLADRGERGFDGLFAQLLGAMIDAAIEQLARIGWLGTGPRPVLHTLFQVMKCKSGHWPPLASPRGSREWDSWIKPNRQAGISHIGLSLTN